MDEEAVELLNGRDALSTLRVWLRTRNVDRLADAATCSDVNRGSRGFALRYLGKLGDQRGVGALVAVLGDENEKLRAEAARSLRALGPTAAAAMPALADALFDRVGTVRIASARALGTLGDPNAIPALLRAAETTSWWPLHSWATYSLAQLGAREAEPHLLQHLDDDRKAVQRRWAAKRLGVLGSDAALEPLRRARNRDRLHRRTYSRAIEAIQERDAGRRWPSSGSH